jgi:hypothetical protein
MRVVRRTVEATASLDQNPGSDSDVRILGSHGGLVVD